jgi:hypothetical protein
MRLVVAALVVLVPTLSRADERRTFVSIGGTAGATARTDNGTTVQPDIYQPDAPMSSDARPLLGPRATLSWEHAPLAMPDAPGYNVGTSLVPEILAGSFIDDKHAEGYVGVGVRGELKLAQRDQGLFHLSARGALYLAARACAIGGNRDPFYEFGFGEYFGGIHTTTRVGFEVSFVSRRTTVDMTETHDAGGLFQLYVGFAP